MNDAQAIAMIAGYGCDSSRKLPLENVPALALVLSDILMLAAAIMFSTKFWPVNGGIAPSPQLQLNITLAIALCCWFGASGHYTVLMALSAEAIQIATGMAFAILITASIKDDRHEGTLCWLSPWLASVGLLPLARNVTKRILRRMWLWSLPAAVIGDQQQVTAIATALRTNWYRRFVVVDEIVTASGNARVEHMVARLAETGLIKYIILSESCNAELAAQVRATAERFGLSLAIVLPQIATIGRGPTRLISPCRTFMICGNSSRLSLRKYRPSGVMRGSLRSLNVAAHSSRVAGSRWSSSWSAASAPGIIVRNFRIPFYCCCVPGLTGPWQVSGRSDVDYVRRIDLDTWYANNRSWIDILILIRTVPAELGRKGAI